MKSKRNIKSILIMAAVSIISLFFINMSLAANTAKINVETANLRETADENSKILEQLSMNESVEVVEKEGDWYKVKAKGITGYLRQDLLKLNNEDQSNATENTVVENATTESTETQAQETQVSEKKEENTTSEEEIKLGKYKIAENTKLKIVPVINATDTIEVKKDEEVTVTEVLNDWVCIEVQATKGWIRKDKLQTEKTEQAQANAETENAENAQTTTETTEENAQAVIKTMFTNASAVNLRAEPNTSSEKVTTLTVNMAVEVISEENGWSKVKVSGKEGYISSSLLSDKKQETSRNSTARKTETAASSATATTSTQQAAATTTSAPASGIGSAVVATARQYIGSRYVYGGSSPSGFDCSGFTSYIYKQYGVSLNRTAAGQYSNGTAVSRGDLQPGDLVMFGKSGISHVAIYAGGGTIIHAANSASGVRTDTINSGYYNNNYVGARRIN